MSRMKRLSLRRTARASVIGMSRKSREFLGRTTYSGHPRGVTIQVSMSSEFRCSSTLAIRLALWRSSKSCLTWPLPIDFELEAWLHATNCLNTRPPVVGPSALRRSKTAARNRSLDKAFSVGRGRTFQIDTAIDPESDSSVTRPAKNSFGKFLSAFRAAIRVDSSSSSLSRHNRSQDQES